MLQKRKMTYTTNEVRERFYNKRLSKGLCIGCGKPNDNGNRKFCKGCIERAAKNKREIRSWYKTHGICPRCGKNDLFGDEKICIECTANEYAMTMKSRDRLGKEHYNQTHREWANKEQARRLEAGVCVRCGKRSPDHGYKTCGICRYKISRSRKKVEKPSREERFEMGLCCFCDNPVKAGYKVCEDHYRMNVEKARSQNAVNARKMLLESGIIY